MEFGLKDKRLNADTNIVTPHKSNGGSDNVLLSNDNMNNNVNMDDMLIDSLCYPRCIINS